MPNFLLIGAPRSGSTSLFRYLSQHPEIFMSPRKEPRFFALGGATIDFRGPGDERIRLDSTTDLPSYQALFAGVTHETAIGEASTIYLSSPVAAERISEQLPDVKLMAILRHPVERAYSAFLHHRNRGLEPLERFEDALADEERRIAEGWYGAWHYRTRGYYHDPLRRYFELFPAQQIRVFLYEDLVSHPERLLRDMFAFLDVDPQFQVDMSARHNVSGIARHPRAQRFLEETRPLKEALKRIIPEQLGHRVISRMQGVNLERPKLDTDQRAALLPHYRQDIQRVSALIGRDLSHWLT